METGFSYNHSHSQQQALSPQVIQSMRILQMGIQELSEYIQESSLENPVIEIEENYPESRETELSEVFRKYEWLKANDHQNSWYHRQDADETSAGAAGQSAEDSFEDDMYWNLYLQIPSRRLKGQEGEAIRYILSSLSDDGYLPESCRELSQASGMSLELLLDAVELVQTLDPAGIGARSLSECLTIQLMRHGGSPLSVEIAGNYLEEMAEGRLGYIAKMTGASRSDVQEACGLIRALNPRPGSVFNSGSRVDYITPDVVIEETEGGLRVLCSDQDLPQIRISPFYSKLLQDTDDAETQEYLAAKLRQAKWVRHCIGQRQKTLQKLAECILRRQEDFFRQGPGFLKPYGLAEAARDMELHTSTVSRTARNKYIQCRYGVYPLSYFFSKSLPGTGGEKVSPEQVKRAIKEIVSGEDEKQPLSDQQICEKLKEQGIHISRRTVAKYRGELNIPTAACRGNG